MAQAHPLGRQSILLLRHPPLRSRLRLALQKVFLPMMTHTLVPLLVVWLVVLSVSQ